MGTVYIYCGYYKYTVDIVRRVPTLLIVPTVPTVSTVPIISIVPTYTVPTVSTSTYST